MRPDISVIIPLYRKEKYIGQAMESVINQTYDGRVELIVIDDCSPDASFETAKEAAAGLSSVRPEIRKIKLLQNEKNMRVAATRNRGTVEAEGEYICFLDADDFWDETKLENQVKHLESCLENEAFKDGPVLLCTAREYVDEDGSLTGRIVHVPDVITYDEMLKTNLIPCSSVMVKKSAALDFPMKRDDLAEDYICWLEIIRKYGPAAGLDEPHMKYREIKGSKSADKLQAAKAQYRAYRLMGLSPFKSFRYLISYAVNGIRKHS